MSNNLKYIKSEKGNDILVNEGFMYHFEKNGLNKKMWRCVNCNKKCRGRIHLNNGEILKTVVHNHVPDNAQIEMKMAINEMKINAISNSNSTHAVIGTLASQVIY